jgi:uroporphyrinogen-III synthase
MLEPMTGPDGPAPWRVAITRADEWAIKDLGLKGFVVTSLPVLVEGPAPDPDRLAELARGLEQFDWAICASTRSVRALTEARGGRWPPSVRTAAVGQVTASAIVEAGGNEPVVGNVHTADGLWERLNDLDDWPKRRVLVTTVAEGRRELIDQLRAAGAAVTEIEAYSMQPASPDRIRETWKAANPDAVIIGSASTARHLVDAVGTDALAAVKIIVAIGPTTAAALAERKISSTMPAHPTFSAAVDHLAGLRFEYRGRR